MAKGVSTSNSFSPVKEHRPYRCSIITLVVIGIMLTSSGAALGASGFLHIVPLSFKASLLISCSAGILFLLTYVLRRGTHPSPRDEVRRYNSQAQGIINDMSAAHSRGESIKNLLQSPSVIFNLGPVSSAEHGWIMFKEQAVILENSFKADCDSILQRIDEYTSAGYSICIDITPGEGVDAVGTASYNVDIFYQKPASLCALLHKNLCD